MTPRERHRIYLRTFEERAAKAKALGDKMTADGIPWERISWVYPDISICNGGEKGTEIIRHKLSRGFLK